MLERLFKSLGFRKDENVETVYDRITGLSRENRTAINDAYLGENFDSDLEGDVQEGLRLWRSGQRRQALELYSRAVGKSPNDSILLLNRAQLQLELGNVAEALCDFERAKAGYPRLPDHAFVIQEYIQKLSPQALQLFVNKR